MYPRYLEGQVRNLVTIPTELSRLQFHKQVLHNLHLTNINLSKPTGHVMHQQLNIQQL